jgi:hypothetical protein
MHFNYKDAHLSGTARLWLASDHTFSQTITADDGEKLECAGTWSNARSREAGFYVRLVKVCDVNMETLGRYSLDRLESAQMPVQTHWRSIELRRHWDYPELSYYKQKN